MNKAMFSGVAGLKTHQSKMDVIGNNVANVNTYGYKAQRAIFSDVFYQTIQGATGGSASTGGVNPSSIGYGSMLVSVQTQMTTSSLQSTGYGLDVAIGGEGFYQVMDGAGNIYYTKAGMLTYDSNGYLVDINGSFVLGASTATSDPDSQKIKIDDIGSVDAQRPTCEMTMNGITYTIEGSNATQYGNVSISMASSQAMPAGLKAQAAISATGAITVTLNAYEDFGSMDELNAAVNAAIKEANGGEEHVAGTFTITSSENVFGSEAVNATVSGSYTQNESTIVFADSFLGGKVSVSEFIPESPLSSATSNISYEFEDSGSGYYNLTVNVFDEATSTSTAYTGTVTPGSFLDITLKSADGGSISLDTKTAIDSADILGDTNAGTSTGGTAHQPEYFLGGATISSLSSSFPTSGALSFTSASANYDNIDIAVDINGTTFTATVTSAGGLVSFTNDKDSDYADQSITFNFPSFDQMKTNLSLASDASVADLADALFDTSGSDMHSLSIKGYKPAESQSLTGAQIVGSAGGVDYGYASGSAATNGFFGGIMTIKGVSSTFEGSGSVSSTGFTATHYDEGDILSDGTTAGENCWELSLLIDGTEYKTTLKDGEQASSLLLMSSSGDYIEVSNPGYSALVTQYESGGISVSSGASMEAFSATEDLTFTASEKSSNLGFGTNSFVLTGGTAGGTITLDELTNISIGSDGTIAVSHADKGTVVAGKISLAVFANSSGLQLMGTNYYSTTANSGEAILVDPGSGGSGKLTSSALEMSNVDISNEFSEMITCQRGFQANSRIITVSDTMLEELINLKR